MAISVAVLMAVASVGGTPVSAIIAPIAVEPASTLRLSPAAATWRLAASKPVRVASVSSPARAAKRKQGPRTNFAVLATEAEPERDFRLDALASGDREAEMTGRRLRRSKMAAGLSLKVVQADGVLSPLVGMSGPVGKAITRVALEVVDAQ